MFDLTPVLAVLEISALANWVGGPICPLISALQILAFSFVIVPVLMADCRIIRTGVIDSHITGISCVALVAFAGAALTGILLLRVQAPRCAENPAAYWRFGLPAVAGSDVLLFHTLARFQGAIAAASVFFWCGIILSGRWIAFAA